MELYYISIHAPHEGVRLGLSSLFIASSISIHAPHEGVRLMSLSTTSQSYLFQSTHPTRGCDVPGILRAETYQDFNPRTPRGGATLTRKA